MRIGVADQDCERWRCHFAVARPLPILDLTANVAASVLPPSSNRSFLRLVRRHFVGVRHIYRVLAVLPAVMLAVTTTTGQAISIAGFVLSLPMIVGTFSVMSRPMLATLSQQPEFVFLTLVDTKFLVSLGLFFQDVRALAFCFVWHCVQVVAMSDALFRVDRICSIALVMSVFVLVVGVVVYLQWVDVMPDQYVVYAIGSISIPLVDIILNDAVTLAVLGFRVAYNRGVTREIYTQPTIRCSIYHAKLRLLPGSYVTTQQITPKSQHSGGSIGRVAPEFEFLQQVRLASPPMQTIDTRNVLLPCIFVAAPLSKHSVVLLHTTGLVGLSSTFIGTLCRALSPDATYDGALVALDIVGLASSLVVVLIVAGNFQRDLLRCLWTKFDVLFILWQLVTGSICLADMYGWDSRTLMLLTWNVWFFFVLLIDALPPLQREHLVFTRRTCTYIIGALLVGLCNLLYAVSSGCAPYQDREIWSQNKFALHTQSYFLNRLLPLAFWLLRMAWEMLAHTDDELVCLDAAVKFAFPRESFPTFRFSDKVSVHMFPGRSTDTKGSSCPSERESSGIEDAVAHRIVAGGPTAQLLAVAHPVTDYRAWKLHDHNGLGGKAECEAKRPPLPVISER